MAANEPFWRKILVWSYARGTIPYDVVCVLILAFIFLTPRACFQRHSKNPDRPTTAPQASAGR